MTAKKATPHKAPTPKKHVHQPAAPVVAKQPKMMARPARAPVAAAVRGRPHNPEPPESAVPPPPRTPIVPPPFTAVRKKDPSLPQRKFRLNAGTHEEYGVRYDASKGDVVYVISPHPLDEMFGTDKFTKLPRRDEVSEDLDDGDYSNDPALQIAKERGDREIIEGSGSSGKFGEAPSHDEDGDSDDGGDEEDFDDGDYEEAPVEAATGKARAGKKGSKEAKDAE